MLLGFKSLSRKGDHGIFNSSCHLLKVNSGQGTSHVTALRTRDSLMNEAEEAET